MRSAFDLSVAEARLVSALAAGQTPKDIASAGGVSIKTVRNQLTSIYGRTGTSGQSELLAMVVGALAQVPSGE